MDFLQRMVKRVRELSKLYKASCREFKNKFPTERLPEEYDIREYIKNTLTELQLVETNRNSELQDKYELEIFNVITKIMQTEADLSKHIVSKTQDI